MPANHSDTSSPSLKDTFKNYQELIQSKIKEKATKLSDTGILNEACGYALLNGGKRFRPALVFMVADALGQNRDVLNAALAIEYFHTASLVADDLPCMDDDEERRNKPTVHKVYGEAMALLVSYALIAEGYGAIAHGFQSNAQTTLEKGESGFKIIAMALENAAFNTGLSGATGGQFLDIFPPDLSEATMREIIHKKTTSLFEIAFVFGWLFGGGDSGDLSLVKVCASHFGLAFQVADDLGDVEQDLKNGRKVNMAGVFGVERAVKILEEELSGYRVALKRLKIDSSALLGLATSLESGVYKGLLSK